jgi:predicted ATP-dependent endonuclease of OLD family
MILIESIEIKYFRSFSDKKVSIENIGDLNIFSGSNDSGKSNVLRALNLFFKNETGPGISFDIDKDLSKIHWLKSNARVVEKRNIGQKEVRQKDLYVDIKIHFSLSEKHGGMLPKKFFVSRRWTKAKHNPPHQNSNIDTRYRIEKGVLTTSQKNALLGQLTQFLHKIEFRYVPAVKDKLFFKHLYKELQGRLLEREMSKIKDKSDELQDVIKVETKELFDEFKKSTGLDASFLLLEESTIDFSKSVEVETIGNIFLTNRGDGIQA